MFFGCYIKSCIGNNRGKCLSSRIAMSWFSRKPLMDTLITGGVCTNWETAVIARGKHRKTALQQLLALLVSINLKLKYSRHYLNATAGCTSCCAISNHLILILKRAFLFLVTLEKIARNSASVTVP